MGESVRPTAALLATVLALTPRSGDGSDRCEAAWRDDGSGGVRMSVADLQARLCRRPSAAPGPSDISAWLDRGRPDDNRSWRAFELSFGRWPAMMGDSWKVANNHAARWAERWLASHYGESLTSATFLPADAPCPPPWTETCRRALDGLRAAAQNDSGDDRLQGLCRNGQPDHDARYAAGLGLRAVGELARAARTAAAWRQVLGEASRAAGWDGAVPWLQAPPEQPNGVSVSLSWTNVRPGLMLPVLATTGHRLVLPAPLLWLGEWPQDWRLQDSCRWERDAGVWGRRREQASVGIAVGIQGDDPARHLLAWRQGFGGGERTMRWSMRDWQRMLAFAEHLRRAVPAAVEPVAAPLPESWPRLRWLRRDDQSAAVLVLRRGTLDPEPLLESLGTALGRALAERWSGWRRYDPLERAVLLAGGIGGEGAWAGLPCGAAAALEFSRLAPAELEPRRRVGDICRQIWQDVLTHADEIERAAAASFALEGFLLLAEREPAGLRIVRIALPDAGALAASLVSALRMSVSGAAGGREDLAAVLLARSPLPDEATLAAQLGLPQATVKAAYAAFPTGSGAHRLGWLAWPPGDRAGQPATLAFAGRRWLAAAAGHDRTALPPWPATWGPSPRLSPPWTPSQAPAGFYRAGHGEYLLVADGESAGRGPQVLVLTTGSGRRAP